MNKHILIITTVICVAQAAGMEENIKRILPKFISPHNVVKLATCSLLKTCGCKMLYESVNRRGFNKNASEFHVALCCCAEADYASFDTQTWNRKKINVAKKNPNFDC